MPTPANSVNEATTGITGFTSTSWVATPATAHNLLVGGSTSSTITNVAPSATSGIPVISQGAAADPIFGTAVVAGGGTSATSFNINGVVISNTTTTGALAALTLTDGQVVIGSSVGAPAAATLTAGSGITITNGHNSITIATSGGGGGSPVQQTRASTSTPTNTSTTMPIATIPQNTDGVQVLSAAITPTNASHILIIEYHYWIYFPGIQFSILGSPTGVACGSALFQDSTANALYAQVDYDFDNTATQLASLQRTLNYGINVKGSFTMTAGTTSSTTFKLRIGRLPTDTSGTIYFLEDPSGNSFGGKVQAVLTISEWTS